MLERFGFTGDRLTARIGDLSGGERRRFQLLRLLLTEPNVLLLDEPTNDLDIETLNVLEDFLDGWPGTLVVVSHDRYFLERVTDSIWALLGDGQISMLPRGVDEYLERRAVTSAAANPPSRQLRQPQKRASRALRQPGEGASRAARRSARPARRWPGSTSSSRGSRERQARARRRRWPSHLTDYERLAELGKLAAELAGRARGARAGVAGGRRARGVTARPVPTCDALTARPASDLHE